MCAFIIKCQPVFKLNAFLNDLEVMILFSKPVVDHILKSEHVGDYLLHVESFMKA